MIESGDAGNVASGPVFVAKRQDVGRRRTIERDVSPIFGAAGRLETAMDAVQQNSTTATTNIRAAAARLIPPRAALAACGLAAALCGQATAANLIVNGGFETPATPPSYLAIYYGGSNLGGWTVFGAGVMTISNTYTEPFVTFNAHSGAAALDITGPGNTLTGGVEQSVATNVGKTYQVGFWVGRADGGGMNPNYLIPASLSLQVNGSTVSTFTNASVSPNMIDWQRFTYDFTATGASTEIGFLNATPANDTYAGLDDVSVVAAPEPAAWLLMIAGIGGMGATLRSRRTRTGLA